MSLNAIPPEAEAQARQALAAVRWGDEGLTREELRVQAPNLPYQIYLKLPASKRFSDTDTLLRFASEAGTLADGEFGETTDPNVEREVLELGGPPAWGGDPLLDGDEQASGSATDTEGLDA